MPPEYKSRLSHFTFSIERGDFIITSERDSDFERTAKVGPVISTVAKENGGNPFARQEAIHSELYTHVWKAWEQYQDGNAPATGPLFDNGNNGNGN